MKTKLFHIFVLCFFLLTSCIKTGNISETQQPLKTLTVITHDSFSISEDLVANFEQENNARVSFLKSGHTLR
jgi:ABC-type thiamine transport system substrate-binding protein